MTSIGLPAIMKMSSTSESMFLSWSMRRRLTASIDIRRHKKLLRDQGTEIDDVHYALCLTQLAQEGYGIIIRSTAGQPKRFQWVFRLDGIVKKAMGEQTSLQAISNRLRNTPLLRKRKPTYKLAKGYAMPIPGQDLPMPSHELATIYVLTPNQGLLSVRIHPQDKPHLVTIIKELNAK